MMPLDPVRDLMRRTMENLRFIEAYPETAPVYHTTQLINSFLGALAHPWERYRAAIGQISLGDAHAMGWPVIPKDHPDDREPTSLGDLLRMLRNGIAHGNIEFWPGPRGEIKALTIWNVNSGRKDWSTTLEVLALRILLDRFVDLAESLHEAEPTKLRA